MSDYAPYNAPYVLSQTYSEDFTNTQSSNEEQLQNLCKSLNYTCTPRNQLERFTEPTLTPEQAKLKACAEQVFSKPPGELTQEDQNSTLAPAMNACMAATTAPTIERFGYPNAIYCTPSQTTCDYQFVKDNGTRTQSKSGYGFNPDYFDDWYAAKMTTLQNTCLKATTDDCEKICKNAVDTNCKNTDNSGCTLKGSTYAPNDKSAYDRGSKHGCIPKDNGTDHNKYCWGFWSRSCKNVSSG